MDSSISSCTEQKKEKNIAIIGAGISGLLACKHAMEKGFNPVVFETRPNIGGAWSSTMDSTKLQTPKDYFQFSDFPWPDSVSETFPNHNQVMNYIKSYALLLRLLVSIMYHQSTRKIYLLGVCGVVPARPFRVHEVDFVILCVGNFSDLPNVPDIPISKGENAFNGEVIHSMDYGAMDKIEAAKFIEDKKVVVVGNHKSGLDIAAEVVKTNGVRHPCTLVFRRAIWSGYKSDQKISNIFTSSDFKNCITGSSAPFYRECIHPKIPQLAILGYSESPSTLFTSEMRSKWLAYFLAGKFKLPTIKQMEEDAKEWEKVARRYYNNDDENYKRACVGALLQIHCNDLLCKDMGCNPKKKKWPFQELFSTYHPSDYADI
ncbi:hypothetical protein ACJIZ3_019307 [Penstemon smallii]|uniref:Flavin-containing monooxygenase n=1 Tax=Penstemon smallii TaxID=265156 RepID=A0ABD3T1B7_9LAMI